MTEKTEKRAIWQAIDIDGNANLIPATLAAARPKKNITNPGARSSANISRTPAYNHTHSGKRKFVLMPLL
jgi:hypothetical protein